MKARLLFRQRVALCGVAGVLATSALAAQSVSPDQVPWTPLFNGKNLDGWVQRGGKAEYTIKDGMIIGTSVAKTPNSFLCTEKDYSDFILELEYKVDPLLNSGIQIRSESKPDYKSGRVHGYQVEIDPSDRAWSGGIYDEGRRGWLDPKRGDKDSEAAYKARGGGRAFKQNGWNHYRIVAVGNRIATWVNGKPSADLTDDMTAKGFIALQVHSVGKPEQVGKQVIWRNIRIKDLSGRSGAQGSHGEKWQTLFDGKSLAGWTSASGGEPGKGWVIEDGVLHRSEKAGDLYTAETYANFVLEFDWRVAKGSNSGVKYRVKKIGQGYLGMEYQVLDDGNHPDGKNPTHRVASLYDMVAAPDDKPVNPVGEWNSSRIVADGTKIEHWLNGKKVVTIDQDSPQWTEVFKKSKYRNADGFGLVEGRILLQDHSDPVWFRNIRIRSL